MKRLQVQNMGPIKSCDVEFGDLTILVGPQASGKSLFAQLFKAIEDAGAIAKDLLQYGYDWHGGAEPIRDYCSLYFGGGLEDVIRTDTQIVCDGRRAIEFVDIVFSEPPDRTEETVFLIPAQRVLVLQDGWPKPFMAYPEGDPYAIRKFSESLRLYTEHVFRHGEPIFPYPHRSKPLESVLDSTIYVGSTLSKSPKWAFIPKRSSASACLSCSAWSAAIA